MLGKLFKKKENGIQTEKGKLYAPVTGSYIPLSEIPDPTFASGMLGEGCGMIPREGKLTAPVDGEIIMVADTKHAIGMRTEDGIEILMHIGIDTVMMNGEGFTEKVKAGDKVKCGQTILTFDLEKIKTKAESEVSAFLISNSAEFSKVSFQVPGEYTAVDEIGEVK